MDALAASFTALMAPRTAPAGAGRRPARHDADRDLGRARPATPAERRRATQELRALAHPLRLKLLEEFAGGPPRTTMQVAASLGEPPTRLYHHVNALERAGILTLARTRQVRGTTEKYFEVAKKSFGAVNDTRLTGAMRGQLRGLAHLMFDEARADLAAAITVAGTQPKDQAPVALRMLLTLSPGQLDKVRRRLMAALAAIRKDCKPRTAGANQVRWALTAVLAPRTGGKK